MNQRFKSKKVGDRYKLTCSECNLNYIMVVVENNTTRNFVSHSSFNINLLDLDKQTWFCSDCNKSGSPIKKIVKTKPIVKFSGENINNYNMFIENLKEIEEGALRRTESSRRIQILKAYNRGREIFNKGLSSLRCIQNTNALDDPIKEEDMARLCGWLDEAFYVKRENAVKKLKGPKLEI